MGRRQQYSVEAIRDEIIAAAEELRAAARAEQDKQRIEVADWLDEQFIDIADRGILLEATRKCSHLGPWRDGVVSRCRHRGIGTHGQSAAQRSGAWAR